MHLRSLLLASFCVLPVACGGDTERNDEKRTADVDHVEVLPYKSPCVGEGQLLCMNVRASADEDARLFYDAIEGFDFEWGHRYLLSVEVTPVENPPADASSSDYELREVLSESEDDEGSVYEFERIELLELTFTRSGDEYFLLGEPFECEDTDDCDALVELNNTGGMVDVSFRYVGDGVIRLERWE